MGDSDDDGNGGEDAPTWHDLTKPVYTEHFAKLERLEDQFENENNFRYSSDLRDVTRLDRYEQLTLFKDLFTQPGKMQYQEIDDYIEKKVRVNGWIGFVVGGRAVGKAYPYYFDTVHISVKNEDGTFRDVYNSRRRRDLVNFDKGKIYKFVDRDGDVFTGTVKEDIRLYTDVKPSARTAGVPKVIYPTYIELTGSSITYGRKREKSSSRGGRSRRSRRSRKSRKSRK